MPRSPQFSADIIDITMSGTADAETAVAHNLQRVPLEAFAIWRGANARLYRGPTAWTSTEIFVRSNVASASFRLFLI